MEFTGERFIPSLAGTIELEHLNRYYFVVNQIDLSGKIVLDIASGEGYGSNILSKYADQVIGVDISSETIDYANEKYSSKNLNFIQGNAIDIPLEDSSMDVIVSFETIEHHDKHIEMMQEIKRVLKSDGILIISTPDKYYYSDLRNMENEFHVKELYSHEFKDLIGKYFKKTFFYSQRTFVGSIIALDDNANEYSKPIVVDNEGNSSEFKPVYNIAIGTNIIDLKIDSQLVLYKQTDKILTYLDILEATETAKQIVRNSKSYQLGKFLLKPFSFIHNKKK